MSKNWTAFAAKRALATNVAARPGISGRTPKVRTLTYFPSVDEPLTDSIILGHTVSDAGSERAHVGGPRHDEEVNLESQIRVVRAGAGKSVADAAEDAAKEILAEVDTEVRDNFPDVGDQSWSGHLTNRSTSLFAWKSGDNVSTMVCLIEFTITYKARTS